MTTLTVRPAVRVLRITPSRGEGPAVANVAMEIAGIELDWLLVVAQPDGTLRIATGGWGRRAQVRVRFADPALRAAAYEAVTRELKAKGFDWTEATEAARLSEARRQTRDAARVMAAE